MISRRGTFRLRGSAIVLCWLALFGAGLIGIGCIALAQQSPTQPQAETPPATEQTPTSNYQPGFFDAFGRWMQEGRSKFESNMKGASEKMGEFHSKARDNAKEAAGAIVGLPNRRVIQGHVRCDLAANGAPDCQNAVTALCKSKGFQTGKMVDTQSEEKCPASVLLLGRSSGAGECKTETFVTRAACQ